MKQTLRQVSDVRAIRLAVIGWRRLTELEHGVFERVLHDNAVTSIETCLDTILRTGDGRLDGSMPSTG